MEFGGIMLLIATACPTLRAQCNLGLQSYGTIVTTASFALLEQVILKMPCTVLFIDIDLPGFDGAATLARLHRINPASRIIVLGRDFSDDAELALVLAGAHGLCSSDMEADQIGNVFLAVARGEIWIRRSLMPRLVERMRAAAPAPAERIYPNRRPFPQLTPREQEIAELVGDGNSNKQIARTLSIAERTVKAHLSEIFRKLAISDRLVLALRVIAMRERPAVFGPLEIAIKSSALTAIRSTV
jgi:DNA-binding NarL/FixJ family response regulator